MTDLDENIQPIDATSATPSGVYIDCPCCGAQDHFEIYEMTELPSGDAWRLSDAERYRYCGSCGAFVDFGAVVFQFTKGAA